MNDEFMQSGTAGDVVTDAAESEKSKTAAALLCFFLGWLGIHRFYVGKVGTGILMLIIGLICAIVSLVTLFIVPAWLVMVIWIIVDFVMILNGGFGDQYGNKLK